MTNRNDHDLPALVERCRQGDRIAWRLLINRLLPVIFSICRSTNLSRDESFDIFGQVSYLILQNLDRLQSPSKIVSYVGTTTRREIYELKRRAKYYDHAADDRLAEEPDTRSQEPDLQVETVQQRELLWEAIALLPERENRLIRLLFFDQSRPDYEEVSKLLNMPVSSIGPTRARTLQKLRRILKKKGLEL